MVLASQGSAKACRHTVPSAHTARMTGANKESLIVHDRMCHDSPCRHSLWLEGVRRANPSDSFPGFAGACDCQWMILIVDTVTSFLDIAEFDRGLWLPCGPSSASSTREGAHAQEVYEPYSEEVKRGNGYSERVYRDTIGGSDAPRRSIRRICAALVVPAVIGALVSCALLASIGPYTVGHGSRKVLRRLFQDDADTESGTKGDDEDPPWVSSALDFTQGIMGDYTMFDIIRTLLSRISTTLACSGCSS